LEGIVQLIFYYVGFMAAGDVADYLIGLVVERLWPQASLVIFLTLTSSSSGSPGCWRCGSPVRRMVSKWRAESRAEFVA